MRRKFRIQGVEGSREMLVERILKALIKSLEKTLGLLNPCRQNFLQLIWNKTTNVNSKDPET